MHRFTDIHSEPDGAPLRRDAHFRVRMGPDGHREDQLLEGKVISMSADGSIDCATVTIAHFYHCGHPATDPIGGQCAEPGCRNISCKECFAQSRCRLCFKPLCLEHVQQLAGPEGAITFCGHCKVELIRKRRCQALFRALLKPFVSFDSRNSL